MCLKRQRLRIQIVYLGIKIRYLFPGASDTKDPASHSSLSFCRAMIDSCPGTLSREARALLDLYGLLPILLLPPWPSLPRV